MPETNSLPGFGETPTGHCVRRGAGDPPRRPVDRFVGGACPLSHVTAGWNGPRPSGVNETGAEDGDRRGARAGRSGALRPGARQLRRDCRQLSRAAATCQTGRHFAEFRNPMNRQSNAAGKVKVGSTCQPKGRFGKGGRKVRFRSLSWKIKSSNMRLVRLFIVYRDFQKKNQQLCRHICTVHYNVIKSNACLFL